MGEMDPVDLFVDVCILGCHLHMNSVIAPWNG
jgi:hypothetical protein